MCVCVLKGEMGQMEGGGCLKMRLGRWKMRGGVGRVLKGEMGEMEDDGGA